jgi:uncharacterized membrane protein
LLYKVPLLLYSYALLLRLYALFQFQFFIYAHIIVSAISGTQNHVNDANTVNHESLYSHHLRNFEYVIRVIKVFLVLKSKLGPAEHHLHLRVLSNDYSLIFANNFNQYCASFWSQNLTILVDLCDFKHDSYKNHLLNIHYVNKTSDKNIKISMAYFCNLIKMIIIIFSWSLTRLKIDTTVWR